MPSSCSSRETWSDEGTEEPLGGSGVSPFAEEDSSHSLFWSHLSAATAGLLLYIYSKGQTRTEVLTSESGRSPLAPQPSSQEVLVALMLNSELDTGGDRS